MPHQDGSAGHYLGCALRTQRAVLQEPMGHPRPRSDCVLDRLFVNTSGRTFQQDWSQAHGRVIRVGRGLIPGRLGVDYIAATHPAQAPWDPL